MGNQQSQSAKLPEQPLPLHPKQLCHHSSRKMNRIQHALSFLSTENSFSSKQSDSNGVPEQRSLRQKYCLKHNEQEQDRLTQLHFLSKHCFNGNYSAPVRNILQQPRFSKTQPRVLDIACGAGTWILEMASEFPNAQFYGIDQASMFPSDIKPPNVYFAQSDVRTGLDFDDGYFDFIHMSYVYNCFSKEERKVLLHDIKRVLKPGGFVEFRDAEHIIKNAGPFTDEYQQKFKRAMDEKQDIDVTWASQMADKLQSEAGLTDIHQHVVSINFWSSSKLNSTFIAVVRGEMRGYFDFFTPLYSDIPVDRLNEHIDRIIDECKRCRSFQNHVLVWGRKRLIDDTSPPIHRLSIAATAADAARLAEDTAESTAVNTTTSPSSTTTSITQDVPPPPAAAAAATVADTASTILPIPNPSLNSAIRNADICQFAHGFTE